ncbi:MAG: hypothetical protein KAG61_00015 [Bacteriovoracaceae bacterium]|nr:hypothetical protein [Bacteriovoracaceae bacterium]
MKLFLLSVFLFIIAPQSYCTETLIFSAESAQLFPAIMGNTTKVSDSYPGMAIEALRILEKKLDLKIIIKRKPWKRVLADLETDKTQGVFLSSYKETRKRFGQYPEKNGKLDPSRRFTTFSYALYKLKDSSVNFDGKKFTGIIGKVGAPLGFSIIDVLLKYGLKVDEGKSSFFDLKKLALGKLSAVAAKYNDGEYYLSQNSDLRDKIERVKTLIVTKPYYFMLSHQFIERNPVLAEKIFDTIAAIREDPAFKNRRKAYDKLRGKK